MQTLTYKIRIHSTPEKVWKCLWDRENYKEWTTVFCQGSYYETDSFIQGNKIHLLTPKGNGMYSILDTIIENKLLVFRHLGEIVNFEEQPIDEKNRVGQMHWKVMNCIL